MTMGIHLVLKDLNFLGQNQTIPTFAETENQRRTLVKMWNISTLLGIIGTILNGIVLFYFYLERKTLFTVVNVMIWLAIFILIFNMDQN